MQSINVVAGSHSLAGYGEISLVIPAFNEENRIGNTLRKVVDYCREKFSRYEVIVVDDCSADGISDIASKYKDEGVRVVRNEVNRGKGYSIKRGVLEAKHSLVLFSDSDLATPIEELDKFIEYMESGFDVVIASRNMRESHIMVKQPLYRQAMGKIFPLLVNLLVLPGFRDTQCGFKLFKTSEAKKIFPLQSLDGFGFDVEILFIAQKMGLRIKEAPVTWIDKEGSKVSPVRDAVKMLLDLVKILLNDLSGKYNPG